MNVNEIKDYIIKKYPESCLASNYQHNLYSDEELIEDCEKFFYYEKLNWCGCGDPEAAKRVVRDFLHILYTYKKDETKDWNVKYQKQRNMMMARFGVESVYDNELLLCFAYAMDAAEFTEHGSSIGGARITKEGEMFLWLLEQNKELDAEE